MHSFFHTLWCFLVLIFSFSYTSFVIEKFYHTFSEQSIKVYFYGQTSLQRVTKVRSLTIIREIYSIHWIILAIWENLVSHAILFSIPSDCMHQYFKSYLIRFLLYFLSIKVARSHKNCRHFVLEHYWFISWINFGTKEMKRISKTQGTTYSVPLLDVLLS